MRSGKFFELGKWKQKFFEEKGEEYKAENDWTTTVDRAPTPESEITTRQLPEPYRSWVVSKVITDNDGWASPSSSG
jgi:hypothetical protein